MKIYKSILEFKDHIQLNNWFDVQCPVYMTSGAFDPLHVGHVRCIQGTVELADSDGGYVVVILNGDGFIKRKTARDPNIKELERAEIITSLVGVDAAIIWDDGSQNVIGAIKELKPDFFTKGGDKSSPEDIPEWDTCQEIGCKVIFNVGNKIRNTNE